MLTRHIQPFLLNAMQNYPAVTLTGPRQSGKTTLIKETFPDFEYVLLEDNDVREYAEQDPRGFLQQYSEHVVFDEIQNVPPLISYLQGVIDAKPEKGRFILSGSQQFSLNEHISQSLAGRTALLRLMPLSLAEFTQRPAQTFWREQELISDIDTPEISLYETLFNGMYPRLQTSNVKPSNFYRDYVETYITRDLRKLLNVGDLTTFMKFLRLCAGRAGQLLNASSLADDAGVDHTTAKRWLSVLETSYIIKLLEPHHQNFNKRLIKAPKLFFLDTGLLCYLLRIKKADELSIHPLIGHIFENFAFTEIYKNFLNADAEALIYFWQDYHKKEIDFMLDRGQLLFPIEVKAGQTINSSYFNNIEYWRNLDKNPQDEGCVIYGGNQWQNRNKVQVIPWYGIS